MKTLKIFTLVFLTLLVLFGIGVFWGKNWINKNLESVVNTSPDRKYNFNFDEVEVDLFRQGILINAVKISPIGDQEGVFVEGKVLQVILSKVNILKLIFSNTLEIQNLSFVQPEFDIHIPLESSDEEKPAEALQGLFGDILSRGKIRNFQVIKANGLFLVGEDELGRLHNLNILATELATDSLKLNYPIPFDFQKIHISIDSIDYILENNQHFKVSDIDFDTDAQQLKMNSLSLNYPEGLRKAATQTDLQIDMIEIKLDSLILSGIEATSNLYSDLNVRGSKLELKGLFLEDLRNKNLPRPADEYKPLFKGMLQKINVPLKLDTLKLSNSTIIYGEIVEGKNEEWQFQLDNLNGDIVHITTIPEFQDAYGHLEGKFTGKIHGSGNLNFDLKIPYDRDEFDMDINLTSFPMTKINEILKPIMNGEIITGDLAWLNIKIHADSIRSTNQFRFDYDNLKIEMFQKGTDKKNRLTSTLANVAMNTSNLPGENNYLTANYTTVRNQYRGPFNLIWQSTREGIMQIVPGGLAREILGTSGK